MSELYGVLEGQRRVREWLPHLRTPGQRVVLGVMLAYCGLDGRISPTYAQIAKLSNYHPSSVRRIVVQLEALGAVMRVGERPVLDGAGLAKGGHIVVWSIPKRASDGASGDPEARPNAIPSAPSNGSKRAREGAGLNVEQLKAAEPLSPDTCRHVPIDEDGYCTACKTWTVRASANGPTREPVRVT